VDGRECWLETEGNRAIIGSSSSSDLAIGHAHGDPRRPSAKPDSVKPGPEVKRRIGKNNEMALGCSKRGRIK
jgi:hypothetical protein